MKKFSKVNNKGITIVALVITIVVLLIISGASIAMLTGNNGIITKAKYTNYANEFSIVLEQIKLKINNLYFTLYDKKDKTLAEIFFENGYMSDEYILDVSKIYKGNLKYGHGNIDIGDYYIISDEKLKYVDANKKERNIGDLLGFGYLPVEIFFNSYSDKNEFLVDNNKNFSFQLTVDNFIDKDISTHDIEYEISIDNKENSNFRAILDNVDLSKENYKGTMTRRKKVTDNHTINVEQKVNNITSEDKLILNINLLKPYFEQKQIEIAVKHSTLRDSSKNQYHAKLKNGAKIIKDSEGIRAISFDGIDDYVEIPTLPENLNWKSGIDIEATVKYDELRNNSSILLLSNGVDEDYFILKNIDRSTNLQFEAQTKGLANLVKYYHTNNLSNALNINEKTNIKVDMKRINTYYDSTLSSNGKSNSKNSISATLYPVVSEARTINYLGRNVWDGSEYFKGLIYYIKVSTGDGKVIFEYNPNA